MNVTTPTRLLLTLFIAGACASAFSGTNVLVSNMQQKPPAAALAINPVPNTVQFQGVTIEVPTIKDQYGAKVQLKAVVIGKPTNKGVSNANVSFAVDGKVLGSGIANASGQIWFDYTVDVESGNHTIEATFNPTASTPYAGGTGKGTLVVAKADATFKDTAGVVLVCQRPYGQPCDAQSPPDSVVIAYLQRASDGKVIGGVPVSARVGGIVKGTQNTRAGDGEVVVNVGPQPANSQIHGDVEFLGNKYYAPTKANF